MNIAKKIRFASRKLRLGINKSDLVLDVGSGHFPNPRADVLCDSFPSNLERGQDLKIDRPFVWGNAERLPFKNDAFDFVVLSHVLEHTFRPKQLLAEIERVGIRGYIETPSAWQEFLIPYTFHVSRVSVKDGVLHIAMKDSWDDALDRYAPDSREGFIQLYRTAMAVRPEVCLTQLNWTRPIRCEVTGGASEETWVKPWELGGSEEMDPGATSGAYKALVDVVNWYVRPNKKVDLLSLLACPQCKGSLVQKNGTDSPLVCGPCGKEYAKYRGHYNFLGETPK